MPRSHLIAACILAPGLLAACADGRWAPQVKEPAFLTYRCDDGGEARIAFNDGGYVPNQLVRTDARDKDGSPLRAVPRSTARLDRGADGAAYELIAEPAAEGLRYRSVSPDDAGHYLVWAIGTDPERTADEAWIGKRTEPNAMRGEGGDGEKVALCTRVREAASSAPSSQSEPHAR